MIYSIPPRNIKGKDYCAYWDNFLSEEQINSILAMPEWLQTDNGVVGGQVKDKTSQIIAPEIRSSKVAWLNYTEATAGLWNKLSGVVADVNSEFFHFDLTGMYEPIQLSVYAANENTNDHYTWHTDMSMTDQHVPRKLSMSLLLSDPSEFEGGELQVKTTSDEIITLESFKGRAWFFPSWVLHRVTPVTKGIRRSLVIWVGGPPFK
jgi:PKHD-type hydroxylase